LTEDSPAKNVKPLFASSLVDAAYAIEGIEWALVSGMSRVPTFEACEPE
jgi:hypothetical protein